MPAKTAVNPWLIAITVSLATFMEVLDTSIANVALPHIAGSMAAGPDERTWVLTSYLVSNAIVIPISGWLSSVIGRKRFYMSCVALFTLSSVACGLAPNLPMLLFFRVLQGVGGGGLAPSEQSILTDTFPREKLGQAFALYAMAVVVAPAIGPALGGWITDTYTWRWIFFINLPVGMVSLFLTYHLVQDSEQAKQEHEEEKRKGFKVDYLGFLFTCMAFGGLQMIMDKGQEDDWFGSNFIILFFCVTVVGFVGLIGWEIFGTKDPIVDLPLLGYGNMGSSFFLMGMVGFMLLASTQLLPQFAQDILGYDATNAGLILLPGGLILIVIAMVTGRLVTAVQPKWIMAVGAFVLFLGMRYMTNFSANISFWTLANARMILCVGLPMLFVPINTLAYGNLPPGKSNNASALVNLMRNLGGSVGIAVATTMLTRREQFHQERLVANLAPSSHNYLQWRMSQMQDTALQIGGGTGTSGSGGTGGGALGGLGDPSGFFHPPSGTVMPVTRALQQLYGNVTEQATVLSYVDVFKILEIAAVVSIVLILLTRRVKLGKQAAAH